MISNTIVHKGTRQHLTAISDGELTAVTFVRDYIQLQFDGRFINAYTLPTVALGGSTFAHSDVGYRDALCARIGVRVRAAYVEIGMWLRIEFSDDALLTISLKPEDRIVAEAAYYYDAQSGEWASW